MANKKTYDSLDVVKWVSALLSVIIHTNPFHGSELLEFYTKDVISRIAVPLFFAISGYLFFRKITFENGKIARSQQNCTYLFRYVKHLILIYLGASSFYLLYKIPPVVFNRLVGTPCAERLSGQFLSLQFRISPLVYPCVNIRHHPVLYFAHFYQN